MHCSVGVIKIWTDMLQILNEFQIVTNKFQIQIGKFQICFLQFDWKTSDLRIRPTRTETTVQTKYNKI